MGFLSGIKRVFFPFLGLGLLWILPAMGPVQADSESTRQRMTEAKRYLAAGEVDFAFMEFRALLEEDPEGPVARDATFAIGEYHFRQHNDREAKEAFQKFIEVSEEGIPQLIARVYLLQYAHALEDPSLAQELERRLKEQLSSKKLFLAFEENRVHQWTSPLGNQFELREFVDRMEITQNGVLFYAIRLP